MEGPMDGDSMQCGTGVSAFRDWKRSSKTQARADTSNITRLLAFREVSPSLRRPKKRLWGADTAGVEGAAGDARPANVKQALGEWVEADSLRHCSAKYTSLHPAPRSTIAAAFSLDGETLASTHGDHTVKIINCQTGKCVKVFSGHRRTPWVVRFHSRVRHVIASGSLDHEVRLWNATTSECIQKFDFLRPIASLAFHASGDLLAVASGHKLYMWQYNTEGEAASPAIVLRTRRSLRAVHFHPHGAPLLLTAEVNDLDSNDCPPATATARSYTNPPPTTMAYTPATLSAMAAGAPSRPPVFTPHAGPNVFSNPAANPGPIGQNPAWPPTGSNAPLPAPAGPVPGMPWNDFWSFESQQQNRQGQQQGVGAGFGFGNPSNPLPFGFRSPSPGLFGNLHSHHPAQSHEQPQRGGPAGPSGTAGFLPRPWAATSGQRAVNSPPLERTVERPSSRMSEAEGPAQMDVSPRPAEGDRWLQRPEAAVAPLSTGGVARALSFSGAASASQSTVLARTDSGGLERNPSDTTESMAIDLASVVSPPPPLSYLNVAPSPATRVGPAQTHPGGSHPEPNVALGYPFTQQLPALGIPPLQQMDLPFWGGWARLGQEPAAGLRGQAPALPGAGPNHIQHVAQGGQQALSVASVAMAAAMAAARAAAQAGAGMMGAAAAGMGHASGMAGGHLNQLPRPFQDMGPAAEAAASAALAAAAAAELPCTVKLRVWPHDINRPTALLDPEKCRLTIPHAVLCSEMGAHFSPCGRFLAACVACRSPPDQEDAFTQTLRALNGGALHSFGGHPAQFPSPPPLQPDSPPQPLQANSVVYELRLYSLEEGTFGEVLASRTVRAAHCLTSIQFSPTSQHILLAYGRRHNTLLRSLVTDGAGIIPVYTILEVYRVADMGLVRVLPSAEDEINVAAFHPQVGGGLVYGTKEGKLRTVTHDRRPRQSSARRQLEDELLEAESNDGPYNLRNFHSTEAGHIRQMEAR